MSDKKPRNKIFEEVPEGTDVSNWVRPVEPEEQPVSKTFPTLSEFTEKMKAHLDELPDDVRAVIESGDEKAIADLWSEMMEEWRSGQ